MFSNVSSVIFHVVLALSLIVLPGLALLRIGVPRTTLSGLSRITIAPGVTVVLTVLVFTWCDLFGLKLGPFIPWMYLGASIAVLLLVRRTHAGVQFGGLNWSHLTTVAIGRFHRSRRDEWWSAVALLMTVTIYFGIRFRATWGWCVPPGVDTEQHTMIVQLLMDHRGLFQSWAPYSDAETFTYHFGFHAITAVYGWLTGLNAPAAVFIMGRVIAAAAAASLFGLVRLWTRSSWGGVFAVAFAMVASKYLFPFETMGRWVLLAGISSLTSGLVLLSIYLRSGRLSERWSLGLLCAITAGGITLTQYKSAIIFAVLATMLFVSRCWCALFNGRPDRAQRILRLTGRIVAIGVLATALAAPRLHAIIDGTAGRYLKHIVVEAPPANSSQFDRPTLTGRAMVERAFNTPRKGVAATLAIGGVMLIALRRRRALWFVVGWAIVTLIMNPSFVGSARVGVIDETHWRLELGFVVAALAGVCIGFITERRQRLESIPWNGALALALAVLTLAGAKALGPVPDSCRYVLPDDARLMDWIRQNIPDEELIAGRGFFDHGEVLGRDAMMWLPQYTRHQTNHTNLAAGLEKSPAEFQRARREFTRELYARDMSTADSAVWMREQGFRWFYAGAIGPGLDKPLLDQLANNPGLEVARQEGAARLYRVR